MSHLDAIDSALRNKGRVLDVGCNTREFFQEMKDTYSIGEIVGVDVIPSEGIVCANLLTDDIDLGRFDAVMSHDCFIMLRPADKLKMLERLKGMLNPGGYIVINDFNRSIFAANALSNFFRLQWNRTVMFAWVGLVHALFRPASWNVYHFGGRDFYQGLDLGMPITYVEGAGYFNKTKAVTWFQQKADKLVQCRDLIVIGPLKTNSPTA
jgi:SAM-dependent methyltransferase